MVQETIFCFKMTSNLPKSVRKFIRSEKARIRSQFLDVKKQEEMISEVYKRFSQQPEPGVIEASGIENKPVIQNAKIKNQNDNLKSKIKTIKNKKPNKVKVAKQ